MRPIKLFRPHPSISRATPDDIPSLACLYAALRDECAQRVDAELLESRFPAEPELHAWMTGGFEVYKAERQRELAGAVRCAFPMGACLLDSLVVSPAHRGEGVARSLLERGLTRARRAGMNRVWLQVLDAAPESTLYTSLGFRPSAPVPDASRERGLALFELLL